MQLMRMLVAGSFLLTPIVSNADLIGMGEVTVDSNTGLEWLDLTATAGLSYNEFLADSDGLVEDGWTLATGNQVTGLISSNTGLNQNQASTAFLELLFGTRALALLGCTLSVNSDLCSFSTFDSNDPFTFAALGIFDDMNDVDSRLGLSGLILRIDGLSANITWDYFEDFYQTNRGEPQVGLFLVRSVSVPEPGTLALFSFGLVCMSLARRRKIA